jgi:hypothetical protein
MKKYLILSIKTFVIAVLLLLLIWFKWWDIYDYISKYRTSEEDIAKIVKQHNLYCDWNVLLWWKAPDLTWKYCSDFKWLEIQTNRKILDCE